MNRIILLAAACAARALYAGLPDETFARYWALIATNPPPPVAFAVEPAEGGADAYRVAERDGRLTFTGSNTRSLLYAVYDFFGRKGCAWFWDGDRLPPKGFVSVAGTVIDERARFAYRGQRYFAHRSLTRFQAEQWDFEDWKREIDWLCKRRLNLMMLRIGMDDLFARAFPDVVPYPEDWTVPEAKPRSYDDRTLFWSMRTRSRLRRQVLDYARERGLLIPEDFGTMSHWYSRTPHAFLEKMKPAFLPQANNNYNERTGLVWDIRDDKWVDAYWRLTEASIAAYGAGAPPLFHTIGLGERLCFTDTKKNREMKVYAYNRMVEKLRRHYPTTPILLGTWDFISTWTPEEVRSFVKTLDPSNTIVFDYTSDIWDEDDNFQNWDLLGNFPWIYGIFHAYEASNEIRGNYANIRQRFPKARRDPMCKGVVYWPEMSHSDTLMLDFYPSLAWGDSDGEILRHLPDFCRRRYGDARAAERLALWQRFLPLAEASRWGTQVARCTRFVPVREFYPDVYFNLRGWWMGGTPEETVRHEEYYVFIDRTIGSLEQTALTLLAELERTAVPEEDDFFRRDALDIRRTILARLIELHMSRIGLRVRDWREGGAAEPLLGELAAVRALGRRFSDTLAFSPEFSLNAALDDLKRKHPVNPDFEKTLKGNAENGYCRSHIYELARYVYEPAFDAFAKWIEARVAAGDRRPWYGTDAERDALFQAVSDAFYARPLSEMKPSSLSRVRGP
jgi:hypothetical protein